jgi:formylglycine-generating enzyme required for sulfatase activity
VGLVLLAAGAVAAWLGPPWLDKDVTATFVPRQAPEGPLPSTYANPLGMEFVLVRRGKFWLGGGGGTPGTGRYDLPYDFYLGKYEVTQEQWQAVMGSNPCHFSRTGAEKARVRDVADEDLRRFPVEMVSWNDAHGFLEKLNGMDDQPGWVYCLPTAAEWEYACRGGPMTDPAASAFDFSFAERTNQLRPDQANFNSKEGRPCRVGSYPPNALGLYDVHGNVSEWCFDTELWVEEVASRTGTKDFRLEGEPPRRAPRGDRRVLRGGSWNFDAQRCRAGQLDALPPSFKYDSLGLRVARVFTDEGPAGRTPPTGNGASAP